MDGFKAYKYYMAVKLHFTSVKYNVFQNGGNVKGTRQAFNNRNDRYIFEKIAQKYSNDKDVIQYFVSLFAYGNPNAFYGGVEADELFTTWQKRKQSITQIFIDDLATIINSCDFNSLNPKNVFFQENGSLPDLTSLFIQGKITIETMSIINDVFPYLDTWKADDTIRMVLGKELLVIEKLKGFVKYDKSKLENIFGHFKEELEL